MIYGEEDEQSEDAVEAYFTTKKNDIFVLIIKSSIHYFILK